jgi:tight adherence protein B
MGARLESGLASAALLNLAIITLAALAVGGVAYVAVMPLLGGERGASKRIATVSQGTAKRRIQNAAKAPMQMRRKQVQDTVKELEAQQKAKKSVSLRTRLMRAGFDISPRTFYLASAGFGLLGFLILLVAGSSLLVSLGAGFVLGVGVPRWVLKKAAERRQNKFLVEFANAIDIIVRGVKTGLPLSDCLQIIANEAPEPVKSAFVDLVEQQRIGIPLSQAFQRMQDRMPLQEVNFFSIVIAIQAQTGGNLAEALGNLSQVLRDRYRLQSKVKAFSAEAKASAMIIGALPIVVMMAVYFTTPDYISVLWTERIGKFLLAAAGAWMLIGILVMRKMINFDY